MPNIKPKEEERVKVGYNPQGDEAKVWQEFRDRKKELQDSRKNVSGIDIDAKMRDWDKNYFNRDADIPPSELDPDQKPIAINNAYGKIQTGLSILIDRNPKIVLNEFLQKYSANRELIRSLAESSWKNTNSLNQFKLSVFNAAKRGYFVGRTLHRHIKHDGTFLTGIDKDGKKTYDTKEVTKMDDIGYINLDNHNVWIDEEAKPEDMYSIRDWMWREVWHIDKVKEVFPKEKFPNVEYVKEGGNTEKQYEATSGNASKSSITKKGLVELYFYEHQYEDRFIVEINNVMVVFEELPQDHKRISLVTGYWNLRSAEDIYGIGVVEEMERDETLIDRILNMTMRQLLLTIAPMGFYSGPEDPENENLKIKPGVIKRVMDAKAINWMQIPPGNQTGLDTIEWLEKKEDSHTGITPTLEGDVNLGKGGDTAFELGVSRESGLKRLRLPLKSFQAALEWEFKNRIDLIRQVYSDYQVQHLANEEDIVNYLDEVGADPDFYFIQNEGNPEKEKFFVKKFREARLNLEQNEKGEFIESEQKLFFKIKPESLPWEGDVTVDPGSILVQSEELEKADTLRMTNLLLPMFEAPIEIALKPAKQLLLSFNKDPKKWLPQDWIDQMEGKPKEEQKQEIPPNVQGMLDRTNKAQTVVPPRELGSKPSLSGRLGAAFQAFRGQ